MGGPLGGAVPDSVQRAAARIERRIGSGATLPVFVSSLDDAWDATGSDSRLSAAPVSLVAGHQGMSPAGLAERLEACGLFSEFVGSTPTPGDRVPVAVLRGPRPPVVAPAPPSFRAVAVVVAYNEEDVIGPCIAHLVDQGLGIYFVDNWSADRTPDIALERAGERLVGWERFPSSGPTATFDLAAQLRRAEAIAVEIDADWVVSNDADELRLSPWPGVTVKDALYHAHQAGFNAVNYTTLEFRLTPDVDQGCEDLQRSFRWFDPQRTVDLGQLNTWRQSGRGPVDLASSGRHTVKFDGRRVFPFNFLLKHYPIRSVEQGERKINRDRLPRYRQDERLRGWHNHYHRASPRSLVKDPHTLLEFTTNFNEEYLLERLTGVGFDVRTAPDGLKLRTVRMLRRLGVLDTARKLKWRLVP